MTQEYSATRAWGCWIAKTVCFFVGFFAFCCMVLAPFPFDVIPFLVFVFCIIGVMIK